MLFANDTSVLFTHTNPIDFNTNIDKIFKISNRQCNANLLSLNFEKTQYNPFINKNNVLTYRKIIYGNKITPNVFHTKILGLNYLR